MIPVALVVFGREMSALTGGDRQARLPCRGQGSAALATGMTAACQKRRRIMGIWAGSSGQSSARSLAIWLAVTAAGRILATFKTLVIIGLIAMAAFIVVWLVARRPHRG